MNDKITPPADPRELAHMAIQLLHAKWAVAEIYVSAFLVTPVPLIIPETYNDKNLHLISAYGDMPALLRLMQTKSDIHRNNDEALRLAAMYGRIEMVEFLLKNEADIHAIDDGALRWAAEEGRTEMIEYLLDHGANIHASEDHAIRFAADNGFFETVHLLARRGASVDKMTHEQQANYELYKYLNDKEPLKEILADAFNVSTWAGHAPEMIQLWQLVPEDLQNEIDFSHIISEVNLQTIKQSPRKAKITFTK